MRRIFQGSFKDQNGNVVGGGLVTVYLAGTSTLATIYAVASGGSAISTSTVTSSSTAATLGYFYFYVDEADYNGSQLFDITLSKSGYTTNTYNNIAILFQPYDAGLESIAELTTAADMLIYTTASDTYAVASLTAAGRALLDDINANEQLITLGALPKAGGTLTGLLNLAAGANIASAATIDLTAATGNSLRITGTTPTSAVTMNTGQQMKVVANEAWPLTYHATTNKLDTGADYTCVAGDIIEYHKDLAGVVHGRVPRTIGVQSGNVVRVNQTDIDVASATSVTLPASKKVTVTGTTPVEVFVGTAGVTYHCTATGVLPLVHSASLNILQVGANRSINANGTFDVYMITGNTCEIRNIQTVDSVWTNYGASSTIVGWSSFTTKEIYYRKIADMLFINVHLAGTSNAANTTFTLPTAADAVGALALSYIINDNVVSASPGLFSVVGNTVTMFKDTAGAAFTATGGKTVRGQFIVHLA